jgi:hypothetical protein
MAQYEKINRITIPLGDEGLILITTELEIEIKRLVEEVIKIRINLLD